MSKIVIPKHSADVDEMNAVLKIHYEANDWVKGPEFKRLLMLEIGGDQYPSSYPKKAQVPAYFGFLESKVSSGGRIIERRITDAGKAMYEAILKNDNDTKRELLMAALEKIIFGRNNAGSPTSDSDIEPPVLLVRCILDTGFCTSSEYAYLVWALNDACKKYYESLDEIIKNRSAGGIAVNKDANEYKDWKPVLAMLRWGFLIKSDDDAQKVLLHPEVIDKYAERLQKLKVYNIDKNEEIVEEELQIEEEVPDKVASYKPFKIDDSNIDKISEGHFKQDYMDIEKQKIVPGDQVLLVDKRLSRLVAYYSYVISGLDKIADEYDVSIKRQFAINKNKENELLDELRADEERNKNSTGNTAIKSLLTYENFDTLLKINGHTNSDVLPAYLLIKALLVLDHLSVEEQDYLVYSIIGEKETYSDAINTIIETRRKNIKLKEDGMKGCANQPSVQMLKDNGIFEVTLRNGNTELVINPMVKEKYESRLKRLSFYAVDIEKRLQDGEETDMILPKVIKAVEVSNFQDSKTGTMSITQTQVIGEILVQGDFIVFVDDEHTKIHELFVYQVSECKKKGTTYEFVFTRRNVINPKKQDEILKMIKGV